MRKVCSKMVPKLVIPEQKETRMTICADLLQNIENKPNFLENVTTCDESWFLRMIRKPSDSPCTGRTPGHPN